MMQNNIIRIMNFKFVKDRVNMSLLYKSMKMLKVKDIYDLEIAKFMHSYYHCKLTTSFDNYFKNASNHHKHNARLIVNDNYYVERANTRKGQQFCSYIGVKIWSKLLPTIKQLTKYSFSTHIKKSMINNYRGIYSLREKNIKYVSFCCIISLFFVFVL